MDAAPGWPAGGGEAQKNMRCCGRSSSAAARRTLRAECPPTTTILNPTTNIEPHDKKVHNVITSSESSECPLCFSHSSGWVKCIKMVQSKSGKRTLNPTDAHRKAQRKKEVKKNKLVRKRNRELTQTLKDPEKIQVEVDKLRALE